jgi:hypothetical protein
VPSCVRCEPSFIKLQIYINLDNLKVLHLVMDLVQTKGIIIWFMFEILTIFKETTRSLEA